MGARAKKRDTRDTGLAFPQTKGGDAADARVFEISSRTTKYALVVLAESLRNKQR